MTTYWKGKTRDQNTKNKISKSLTGRKLSSELIAKMSKRMKGVLKTQEWKEKVRKTLTGKKHSIERRKHISESLRGKKQSKEQIRKRVESFIKVGGGKWNKGKKHSLETRKKMSESHGKGEMSHSWRGGVTPINQKIRHSFEYKLWRESVFKRDNYTCLWCGIRSAKGIKVIIHADHIKPFAYYPELRFAIDNGRTLCIDCHEKTDTYKCKKLRHE